MSRKTLSHNAEVTMGGIKPRGSPAAKGKQKLVTVTTSPVGKFKKNIIYLCLGTMAMANGIGLAMDWTPDLVHVAYPLAGVFITGLLTTFLTKME